MPLKTIDPKGAAALLRQGATLIDVREPDERAREHVAGSRALPLSRLREGGGAVAGAGPVIFHCRSGSRTQANAETLAAAANCEAYLLEGGLEAWKAAGLPVARDAAQPIELMRQVQIAAGSMVLAGVLLGALVSPAFYGLSGFVGAGLVFAGVTGWCGMAKVLGAMPWNRRAAAARAAA
jgi:rhodanese-related sulfurtransferase